MEEKKPKVNKDQLTGIVKGILGSVEPLTDEQAKQLMALHENEIKAERTRMDREKREVRKEVERNGGKPKNRAGRPTKYRPEMCIQVIQSLSTGQGMLETACHLKVLHETMTDWTKIYPRFSVAIKIGRQLCELWWRNQGRLNMHNRNFNHILWMMNMSNRFNWKQKVDQTETIKGETTVTHKHVVEQVKKRPEKELIEVLEILIRHSEGRDKGAEAKGSVNTTVH